MHAQELLLTAAPIDAARAAEIGLVNRVRAGAAGAARGAARRRPRSPPTRRSPCARRAAACASCCTCSLDEAWRRQEELGRPLRKSDDAAEGARAFLEKRTPKWTGR